MLQLVYSLTGDDAYPPIVDGQIESYLQKLKHLLENAIWTGKIFTKRGIDQLFSAYNALAPEQQVSLFLSPEGYEAVNSLAHSVTEESAASMARLCQELSARDSSQGEMETDRLATSFIVNGFFQVDIRSPFCQRRDPTSPVFFGEFQPFTEEEIGVLKNKMAAALSEIQTIAPTFLRIIQNYTRTGFIRKNGTLLPASEQVDTELGGIRLRNVHLVAYTHEQLMDDLIHESVHNFLATFELLNYPFVAFGGRNHPHARPVSPWSMRPIRVLPFLHAAFVYFALLHFSMLRLQRGELNDKQKAEALRHRNHCASGFLMPGRLSLKVKDSADVDVRVLQMLDWMQETVIDLFTGSDLAALENKEGYRAAAA